MNVDDFTALVFRMTDTGTKFFTAIKIVEKSGIFSEEVIAEFWEAVNNR